MIAVNEMMHAFVRARVCKLILVVRKHTIRARVTRGSLGLCGA